MNCPRCQHAGMAYDEASGKMRCPACGFRLFQDSLEETPRNLNVPPWADAAQAKPPKRPPVPIDTPRALNPDGLPNLGDSEIVRMRGRCQDVMYALSRNDLDAAQRGLRRILDINSDYADAWLMLAGLAQDGSEQRVFLEQALACDPGNPIAVMGLGMLDGKIDIPQAGSAKESSSSAPQNGPRVEPGQVVGERLACPQCGGDLGYRVQGREVVCRFCGHRIVAVDALKRSGQQFTLAQGLLKRKRDSIDWNIGGRWLRCGGCGAITTLSQRTLTDTCRFCGSRHILQEGVNLQFEQPDVIVPFCVDEAGARASIDKALRSGVRMITRFFADAIARVDVYGVYLPFWVFDADMIVHWSWSNAPDRGDHPVLLNEVPFLATMSALRPLANKIEPFDLRQGVDYDPRLLAIFPARLYDVDVARASIDVRTKLSRTAQDQARIGLEVRRPSRGYGGGYGGFGTKDDDPGSLQMHAVTDFLTYRLALLPVWLARLTEEDGDTRLALINGQTGEAALGKVEKHS